MSVPPFRLRRGYPPLRLCLVCVRLFRSLLVLFLRTELASGFCLLGDPPIADVQVAFEGRLLSGEVRTQDKTGDGPCHRGTRRNPHTARSTAHPPAVVPNGDARAVRCERKVPTAHIVLRVSVKLPGDEGQQSHCYNAEDGDGIKDRPRRRTHLRHPGLRLTMRSPLELAANKVQDLVGVFLHIGEIDRICLVYGLKQVCPYRRGLQQHWAVSRVWEDLPQLRVTPLFKEPAPLCLRKRGPTPNQAPTSAAGLRCGRRLAND